MGAVAARKFKAPYLITEHGIYNNERLAEISRANWIYEAENTVFRYSEGLSVFKRLWVEFFFFLSRVAYSSADLFSLFIRAMPPCKSDMGRQRSKMEVLPNGIDPNKFDEALRKTCGANEDPIRNAKSSVSLAGSSRLKMSKR